MPRELLFWLSVILICACLLLCLQKRKRVVPFIREVPAWGRAVAPVSVGLTLLLVWLFGIELTVDNLVLSFALIFAIATVVYFLFQLSV